MRLLGEAGTAIIALGLSFAVAACAPVEPSFMMSKARDGSSGSDRIVSGGIGERFTIDGIAYTVEDVADYDEVGYATILGEDEDGATHGEIAVAHRTLPIGSTVEITSLDSGLRVQARVKSRGPMVNSRLTALAPEVLTRLGMAEGSAVRVKRVSGDQAALSDVGTATKDITAPAVLDILKRSLPVVGSASLRAQDNSGVALALSEVENTQRLATVASLSSPAPRSSLDARDVFEASKPAGAIVKTGTFASKGTAERVARDLDAQVVAYGRNWRVVSDTLANGGQAEATLAKVRGAGYRDAQIYTVQ